MNFDDIQWFYIIASFVFGGVFGAWVYSSFNTSSTRTAKIRHELAERELELNQARENLNDHFSRTATHFSALGKQLQNMEEQLASDAAYMCSDEGIAKRLAIKSAEPTQQLSSHQPPIDYASNKDSSPITAVVAKPMSVEPPRDYAADKAGGTLAEDFGLKKPAFNLTKK